LNTKGPRQANILTGLRNKKGQGGDPGLVIAVLEIRPNMAAAPFTFFSLLRTQEPSF
jgi:hypothetical protein